MADTRYLVLTAVGTDRPGIVAELTGLLVEQGANVADSRMAVLGGEFAFMVLVEAPADAAARLQESVTALADRMELQLLVKPTASPEEHRAGHVRSYRVAVHALDHPGIVRGVTSALQSLGANVVSLESNAYPAPVTGAPLFRMNLLADFPPEVTAARVRETLDDVSDLSNVDLDVEPA